MPSYLAKAYITVGSRAPEVCSVGSFKQYDPTDCIFFFSTQGREILAAILDKGPEKVALYFTIVYYTLS